MPMPASYNDSRDLFDAAVTLRAQSTSLRRDSDRLCDYSRMLRVKSNRLLRESDTRVSDERANLAA